MFRVFIFLSDRSRAACISAITSPAQSNASLHQIFSLRRDEPDLFGGRELEMRGIMFDIVYEPATKTPIEPIRRVKTSKVKPVADETPSASTIGIDAMVSKTQLRKTLIIGRPKRNAGAAAIIVRLDDTTTQRFVRLHDIARD